MKVEFVGRHMELDPKVKQYTENKLKKITKFLEEPIEVRVTLNGEKHRQIAELHVAHRFGVLQASEETDRILDSVNLAVDKVEKQARRGRKKHKDKRRRSDRDVAHEWPVEVLEKASVGEGSAPKIIRSSRLAIYPMSLDEAAEQLEDSTNDFVVFRDAESGEINVLYKRRDENYGLISAEA